MMIYSKGEPTGIYDVEALHYVQEPQLDKFKQELSTPSATVNVTQSLFNSAGVRPDASNAHGQHFYRGRGRQTCGRGRGRKKYASDNMPTCQLCNRYGHYVLECWHRFDEHLSQHNQSHKLKLLLAMR